MNGTDIATSRPHSGRRCSGIHALYYLEVVDSLEERLWSVLIGYVNNPGLPSAMTDYSDRSMKMQATRIRRDFATYILDGQIADETALDEVLYVVKTISAVISHKGTDSDLREAAELVRDLNRYRNRHFPQKPLAWRLADDDL
jgi:hypothetical protein